MRTREAGFTLVELLVAMALLALLATLLLGGLRASRIAVTGSESATERLLATARGIALMRRELQEADPLPLGNVTEPRIAFAGDASSVVFIAPPGAYLATGGEEITWLAIENGRIVLRYRPLDRASDRWPPLLDPRGMTSVVLLDGVARAELAYFGRMDATTPMQWQTAWRDAPSLPTLIRLSIASGGATWPDLVVTPRLGRPVGTGFLTGGALCRRGTPPPC